MSRPTAPHARRSGSYDLPLKRDATGRFLPWIIALMVYLATLAVASWMLLSDLAGRWQSDLAANLTVQVLPQQGAAAQPVEARVARVMAALGDDPGVANARVLSRAEAAALVQPWLGDGALLAELPVPTLVDVELAPRADIAAIRARVAGIPGVTVDDPGTWLADLRRLASTIQWVAAGIVGLIGGVAVAAVVFAASSGFAVHRAEVELLHVIGASDGYVAGQFQRHMVRLTLVGGGAGAALALLTLWALDGAARRLEAALLPSLGLDPVQWLWLLAVPACAALLAAVTARFTVMRALERMP